MTPTEWVFYEETRKAGDGFKFIESLAPAFLVSS
jgi:hypothetical protein